jgi:hypothetical protein
MVAKGSEVVRRNEDRLDNLKVLLKIAKNKGKVVVEAQKEMLAGKSASETSAAQEVSREERIREARKKSSRRREGSPPSRVESTAAKRRKQQKRRGTTGASGFACR